MARSPEDRGPHAALPWFLGSCVLTAISVVYAVLSRAPTFLLVSVVLAAVTLGVVLGTATRDSQDRVISVRYSLVEGLRRLGHRLWF